MSNSLLQISDRAHTLPNYGHSFNNFPAPCNPGFERIEQTPAYLLGKLVIRPIIDEIGKTTYPIFEALRITRNDIICKICSLSPMAKSCPRVNHLAMSSAAPFQNSKALTCSLIEPDFSPVEVIKPNFEEVRIFKSQHKPSQIQSYHVEVEKNWSIYVEESGNPEGIPVVFVHGGPGARFKVTDHQWFDPEKYRIIAFQQRGTYKCVPSAEDLSVNGNLFKDIGIETLARDIEVLRNHLGISNWLVFGGSWGSTLGIYYAQEYPTSCSGLIIRGIFLSSKRELTDFYTPEKIDEKVKKWNVTALEYLKNYAAERGLEPTAEKMIAHYRKMIVEDNDIKAARLWRAFEEYIENGASVVQLERILSTTVETLPYERSVGLWETQMFNQIIEKEIDFLAHSRLQNLKGIPIKIVQGEKDPICPPIVARKLVEQLLHSKVSVNFSLIEEGKHSPYSDPGMIHALVSATDQFALTKSFE